MDQKRAVTVRTPVFELPVFSRSTMSEELVSEKWVPSERKVLRKYRDAAPRCAFGIPVLVNVVQVINKH